MKTLAAAALLAAPLLASAAPAEALTANQYKAQGHGVYMSSKGHRYGYSNGDGYGYRQGWRRPYPAYRQWRRF